MPLMAATTSTGTALKNVNLLPKYRHNHIQGCHGIHVHGDARLRLGSRQPNYAKAVNLGSGRGRSGPIPIILASSSSSSDRPRIYVQELELQQIAGCGPLLIQPLHVATFPASPSHQVDEANANAKGWLPPPPKAKRTNQSNNHQLEEEEEEDMMVAKLRLVAAAAADRAEMHDILSQQRDGWNKLFHGAFTNMTLSALILSALPGQNPGHAATLLYLATTGMMCLVNKIQPSQLAEEQRMAARLFRQLNVDIHTNLAMPPHLRQEKEQQPRSFLARAYNSVLALDKAYPLPLFPGMLDKFPNKVEPTVWWPQEEEEEHQPSHPHSPLNNNVNGWSADLENHLREVSQTLKSADIPEFVELSRKVLQANTILAIGAPLLTGIAGALNMFGSGSNMAMVAGVLGMVANTLSHGGQIGMVFEMYRNSAGFYHFLDSSIQRTLAQSDPQRRENGELFLWRLALRLGRPPRSPLLDSASKFAGRLF